MTSRDLRSWMWGEALSLMDQADRLQAAAIDPRTARGAAFPDCSAGAHIHTVEIPYGRFERRIGLPMHALELSERHLKDGVLTLTLRKRSR